MYARKKQERMGKATIRTTILVVISLIIVVIKCE